MLNLKTEELELRGIESRVSEKTNQAYYLLYCENMDTGEPYKLLCRDFNAIPQGLKKGDIVVATMNMNSYKDLFAVKVEKVG